MFAENIKTPELIAVLEMSWNDVDKTALPRPYHALSFRIKGNAQFSFSKSSFSACTGDIIFVPKNVGYHLNATDEHIYCVHFLAEGLPKEIIKFSPESPLVFEKIYVSMYNRWTQKKPGYLAGTMSDLYKLISKIQIQENRHSLSSFSDDMSDIIEYIHAHFTEPDLTVLKISEMASLSESHFRKVFKEYFGTSPLQYVNNLRVKHALELLDSGYYKIYEIAEMAGFSDTKYFSTVIKKFTGASPAKHKRG